MNAPTDSGPEQNRRARRLDIIRGSRIEAIGRELLPPLRAVVRLAAELAAETGDDVREGFARGGLGDPDRDDEFADLLAAAEAAGGALWVLRQLEQTLTVTLHAGIEPAPVVVLSPTDPQEANP